MTKDIETSCPNIWKIMITTLSQGCPVVAIEIDFNAISNLSINDILMEHKIKKKE